MISDREVALVFQKLSNAISIAIRKLKVESDPNNIDAVLGVLASFDRLLRSEEIRGEFVAIRSMHATIINEAIEIVSKGVGITGAEVLTGLNARAVELAVQTNLESIFKNLDSAVSNSKSIIVNSIVAGELPDLEAIAEATGKTVFNIKTEALTAIDTIQRAVVTSESIRRGVEMFEYSGQLDKKTRPFCVELLTRRTPPTYSIDEIRGMDNGQGLDVINSCGGYNCRHMWLPVKGVR
jgi:hypothetical protein